MPKTAIVGYSARLPGAETAQQAWEVLCDGRCTVTELPEDRWSALKFHDPSGTLAGFSHTRAAGVLADPWGFDAAAFGISPREAAQMDPQQRLLIELTNEAFDHAGIDPARLDRARTGVYVGASAADHSTIGLQDPRLIESHYMLGNTLSILSNRISYLWDLQGPSMTVDTACSSGLVAFDLAHRAITSGEIDTAIVAGVSMLLSPVAFIGFSHAGMLSHRGRCSAFGAAGDGYVRSEGGVVFVLRRDDLAKAEGLRLRAIVAGTGVNTAGYTRGITIPSQERQSLLIGEVMARAGIDPDDLAFAEAHGTGTPVGDPREAAALGETYGQRRQMPLPIGSAKSNFGHLEPASGLVGLLKAQMSLERHYLPATLFAQEPNPDIDFAGLNLAVMNEPRPLPERARPWAASVNSFGFGGANAHVVIREAEASERAPDAPADAATAPSRRDAGPLRASLLLSAPSESALLRLGEQWQQRLTQDADFAGLVANANYNMARRAHRLCLAAGTAEVLRDQLDAWLRGDHPDRGGIRAQGTALPVAFVFSGNGALWEGMARQNFLADPAFRRAFQSIEALVVQAGGPTLSDLLMEPQAPEVFLGARVAQILHFAIQIALVDALAAVGLRPSAVMGHSLGEVAAAVVAERISRAEGVHIVLSRSATFAPLKDTGTMAALSGSRQAVADLIAGLALPIDVSAENSATSVTVSGTQDDLQTLLKAARKARIAGKLLPVAYPYHSRAVAPLEARMRADLAGLAPRDGEIAFYSGCLGRRADRMPLDADYWWQNARNPVEFRAATAAMVADDCRIFLEISPRTVLRGYLKDVIFQSGEPGAVIEGLDRNHPELRQAADIARRVLAAGGDVTEATLLGPRRQVQADLPPHPVPERQTFRLATHSGPDIFGRAARHPLLGARSEWEGRIWSNTLSLAHAPWLGDHRVGGRVLLPATAMAEIFLAAALDLRLSETGEAGIEPVIEIADLDIFHAIVLPEEGVEPIRVIHDAAARRLTLESGGEEAWQKIATARLFTASDAPDLRPEAAAPDTPFAPVSGLYEGLRAAGLDYGPAFARLAGQALWAEGVDVCLTPGSAAEGFLLDPTASDAALHGAALLPRLHAVLDGQGPMVPGRIGRLRRFCGAAVARARLTLRHAGAEDACLDVVLYAADGTPVAAIDELRLRRMPQVQADAAGLYWEEILLPLAGERQLPAGQLGTCFDALPAEEEASDIEVLRGALAARLAWDACAGTGQSFDPERMQVCHDWLTQAGYMSADGTLEGDCPWPEFDALVAMLGEVPADVQEDLNAALRLVIGVPPKALRREPVAALRALGDALERLPQTAFGTVLLTGPVDTALLAAAGRVGSGLVTVAVEDKAQAGALRPVIAEAAVPVAVLRLDDPAALRGKRFDLIAGAATATGPLSPQRLCTLLAAGGSVLLAEEKPDLFALLSKHQPEPAVLERLETGFAQADLTLSRAALTTEPTVVLLLGTSGEASGGLDEAAVPEVRPVAKAEPGETGEEALIRCAAAFRDLPESEAPLWISSDKPSDSAALFALRRVVANERGRDLRVIVHTSAEGRTETEHLARIAALMAGPEHEIVADDASGLPAASPRLIASAAPQPIGDASENAQETLLRLAAHRRSPVLDGLYWQRLPRPAPGPDEVEIEVEATGLNFRDVMWGQGLIPPEALQGGFAGQGFGMECAGRVSRAGREAAQKLPPGTPVLAFAPHAFASHVIVPAHAVMPRPEDMPAAQAAASPVVFLTADYALNELARLASGETVLIHGAAGGVGIAAVQIARGLGARVIATAGSPEKRRWLAAQGVDLVLDSRAGDFSDRVLRATGGRGADVVLNALAGEGLERGLSCLAPFGRFVELGKRDIYENNLIALRAFRNNISLFAVDADQLLQHRPQVAERIMTRIGAGLAAGQLQAPPTRVLEATAIGDAFRLMQRSGHIGKIVVRAPKVQALRRPAARRADLSGNWLITGGGGGFGFETAQWLRRQGADRIWLTARSARPQMEDRQLIHRVADVTDEAEMRAVLAEMQAQGGVAGIIHAAAVLDDARFEDTDADRIARVASAKLGGLSVLDRLTQDLPLRHFWVYSSVAARFGNPAQAAYAAANAQTEALMRARAAAGLPGLAIAWGPIADTGMLARNEDLRKALSTQLGGLLTAGEALDALGRWLADAPKGAATVTIAPIRWGRLAADLGVLSEPLFAGIDVETARSAGAVDLAALVAAGKEAEARRIALEAVLAEAAQILRLSPEAIDPQRPLSEHGLDSLMAMNLKLAIEERFGIEIPARSLAGEPSPGRLVQSLFDTLDSGQTAAQDGILVDAHLSETVLDAQTRARIDARLTVAAARG